MNKQNYSATDAAGCGYANDRGYWRHHNRYSFPFTESRRAPVSIYKTENSYEMMLFAPGRQKENFSIQLKGDEMVISYKPSVDTSGLNWVRREYSRGGFERSFMIDSSMDADSITSVYENGVLTISIPFRKGGDPNLKDVKIS